MSLATIEQSRGTVAEPFAVSIDRLTFLGTIADMDRFKEYVETDVAVRFGKELNPRTPYDHSGILLAGSDGAAYFNFDARDRRVRLEFNPKHATASEDIDATYKNFLSHMRLESISRIDVAFDFDRDILGYDVTDHKPNRKQTVVMNGRKQVETRYLGTRSSTEQIVFYDKKKEQEEAGKEIPEGLQIWHRVEVRLMRSDYIEKVFLEWDTYNPFDRVVLSRGLPSYEECADRFRTVGEYAELVAYHQNPALMKHLGKNKRPKVKRLIEELLEQTGETIDLKQVWDKKKDLIQEAIREWASFCNQVPSL